jgi:hypothetical protein
VGLFFYVYGFLCLYIVLRKDISQQILQNMQHTQTYHLHDEVHTPYFQQKHSILIHKQRLNTVNLY